MNAIAVVLLLAVVGGEPVPARAESPVEAPSGAPVTVLLAEYGIEPAEIVVAPGSAGLRIVNAGIRRHNVVILIDGVEHASPEARPGDVVEWSVAVERPGRYLVWCGEYRHLEKGMTATLVVE